MAAKFILVLCASALFIQQAYTQALYAPGYPMPGYGSYGYSTGAQGFSSLDVDIDAVNYGSAYASGYGSGYGVPINAVGLGGAGLGLGAVGLGGAEIGLGGAGFGLGGAGLGLGLGSGLGVSTGAVGVAASPVVIGGLSGLNVGSSGPLVVTTISPIGPSGLAVASEIVLEGILTVSGQLPFLSAVAFEGAVPTSGSGVATCGCGSGSVGIVSEGFPNNYGIGSGIGGVYF